MINIHYTNRTKTALPKEAFFDTIRTTLKNHGITDNVDVELRVIGKAAMQKLNRTYRHKDYATDVLSFPVWHNLEVINEQLKSESQVLLGSVVVCLPVAERDAKQEGKETVSHIQFLIDHSLLHLMGFHHEGDE